MSLKTYIFDVLKPDGIQKENTKKLYNAIVRVFDIIESDVLRSFNGFSPFLAEDELVDKHREALGIMKFPIDNYAGLRERVGNGFRFLQQIGEKGLFDAYLEANFAGRYEYIELPKQSWRMGFAQLGINTSLYSIAGLRLYVDDLTDDERSGLSEFLDGFLDADVEFKIFERKNWGNRPGWKLGYSQSHLGVDTFLDSLEGKR